MMIYIMAVFLLGALISVVVLIYRYIEILNYPVVNGEIVQILGGYAGRGRVNVLCKILHQGMEFETKSNVSLLNGEPLGRVLTFYVFEDQNGIQFKAKYGYIGNPIIFAVMFCVLALMQIPIWM